MSDEAQAADATDDADASAGADKGQAKPEKEQTTLAADASADEGSDKGDEADAKDDADADPGKGKDDADDKDQETEGEDQPYKAFELPEGMELDEKALEAATPIFTELGLSQENAQKVISMYADLQQAQHDSVMETWTATQKEWRDACEGHKELGGDNLDASQTLVAKGIDAMFSKERAAEYRAHLNESGYGNNPFMFEVLAFVGKLVSEDGYVAAGAAHSDKTQAEVMFPDMNQA